MKTSFGAGKKQKTIQKNHARVYDYGVRYYDPKTARFINVDPIIEKFPELTPYNYASNNPVTLIDLWGLQGVKNKYQQNVLNAVDKVNHLQFGFPTKTNSYNHNLWYASGSASIKANPIIRPSIALGDIEQNSNQYSFDCAEFVQVINLIAFKNTLGSVSFDFFINSLGGLQIKPYTSTGMISDKLYQRGKSEDGFIDMNKINKSILNNNERFDLDNILNEIPIGSRVVIRNLDERAIGEAFMYENMIKTGNDQYYAHPFGGPYTLDQIKYNLAKETNPNPDNKYIDKNIFVNMIETYKQPEIK